MQRALNRYAFVPLVAAAAILFYAAGSVPSMGDPDAPASTHVSPRYIEKALEETGAANMVTAVLADYRGYDTLGETVVIFTAGLACLLVLGAFASPLRSENPTEQMTYAFGSDVLDAASRVMIPFIVLFAVYVVVHGHTSPGGGFQGGAILAAALILVRLVRGRSGGIEFQMGFALVMASMGVFAYAGIGFLCMVFGGNFLDYGTLPLPLEGGHLREMGTLGVEFGVFLGVTAVLFLIFDSLTTGGED
jgi:multicomponent Na+:H+ antiporter subunit B